VLLRKRLEDFGPHLRIEKTARGRFRLVVTRPVGLLERA
jgi:adenylate cyclase